MTRKRGDGGAPSPRFIWVPGWSGGTFVVKAAGNVPLIVAGGGGAPGNCGAGNGGVAHGSGGKSYSVGAANKLQEDGIQAGDGKVRILAL